MCMTFAKPIIAMLGGDGKDALIQADGGLICEQSVKGLITGIKAMMALSPEERKRLGNNNLTYYNSNYSLKIVSEIISKELSKKSF